jgi:AraC family transcriptional regulator of adaptative response / DNA-3-methyladenine glycosylase II
VRGATRGRDPANAAGDGTTTLSLTCQLDFRPPLAWESLLAYLHLRAIPGVEAVADGCYRRTAAIDGHAGWISVSLNPSGHALDVRIAESLTPVIGAVLYRLKHLFDLGAAPEAVSAHLVHDALLAPVVRRLPGLRVPGAFDGFELAVRAVLGQQVSVKSATTFAGRWARVFGAPIATPYADLCRLTPPASRMADAASVTKAQVAALGIVGSRAKTLIALAAGVADRRIQLSYAADVDAQIESLMQLPGVGPWTAQYIAMRALHWPDAFPSRDLVLLKAARTTHRELVARAQAWRPWRAYAAHYLWQSILGVSP